MLKVYKLQLTPGYAITFILLTCRYNCKLVMLIKYDLLHTDCIHPLRKLDSNDNMLHKMTAFFVTGGVQENL